MKPHFFHRFPAALPLAAALLSAALPAASLRAQESAGKAVVKKPLPTTLAILQGTTQTSLPLKKAFRLEGVYLPTVRFSTVLGNIDVQVLVNDAPKNAANFLSYVDSGAYNDSFFDRSVKGFVIQGGSYRVDPDENGVSAIMEGATVVNEYKLPNTRGTLAAAKPGGKPDGATKAWFFNTVDNTTELGKENTGGFTVYGNIIGRRGFTVMDAIAAVPVPDTGVQPPFTETPLINHVAGTSPMISELVKISSVARIPTLNPQVGQPSLLRIGATSSNPALVTPRVVGSRLVLTFDPSQVGNATIVVRAKGPSGGKVKQKINVTVSPAE